ncbi:MAG: hypothetical protein WCY19_06950, partial [Candidatus Gastranaerophilaceae bacterium]
GCGIIPKNGSRHAELVSASRQRATLRPCLLFSLRGTSLENSVVKIDFVYKIIFTEINSE